MIHLIGNYYMTADEASYTVGTARQRDGKRLVIDAPKYYSTVESAVASTAERALRDGIAAGNITTLHDAVEELRRMKDEIRAAIDGQKED